MSSSSTVRMFDGTDRPPFVSRYLVIEEGQIVQVDAATAPAGAERLDGTDLALLPGLVDFHVHLWAPDGADLRRSQPELMAEMTGGRPAARRALVEAGVTTVRSVGDPVGGPADVLGLRRQVVERAPGPRLFCTGPLLTGPDGHPAFLGNPMAMEMMTRRVRSAEEARARVAELVAMGVDGIKVLYDDGGGLLALMPVETMRAAVEAGADTLEHSPARGRLDEATLALMRERGVLLVPTLAVREGGGMTTSREAEAWAEEARRRRAEGEDPLTVATANTMAAHRAGHGLWKEPPPGVGAAGRGRARPGRGVAGGNGRARGMAQGRSRPGHDHGRGAGRPRARRGSALGADRGRGQGAGGRPARHGDRVRG
jgi:hypothetical protein